MMVGFSGMMVLMLKEVMMILVSPILLVGLKQESGWVIQFKMSLKEPMRLHLVFLHQKPEESFLRN